jgi:hypothetical protein
MFPPRLLCYTGLNDSMECLGDAVRLVLEEPARIEECRGRLGMRSRVGAARLAGDAAAAGQYLKVEDAVGVVEDPAGRDEGDAAR